MKKRRLGDVVMNRVARILVSIFFRQIDVESYELPPGPLIVVANHANGLVDGLVLMGYLPRYPRFLGKSTLWKILPLAPFLRLAGAVPVYRAADGGGTERNVEAFRTAADLLAAGGVVGVFPEGISHDEGSVQPLRTGTARIALAAAEAGVTHLTIVAAGLIYDDKATFRSRALVRLGAPAPVDPWLSAYRDDPVATVRALTESIASQLAEVAPMFSSRHEELACRHIAGIVTMAPDGSIDLANQEDLARRLAAAAADDDEASDRRALLSEVLAATERYDRDLALAGVRDAEVTVEGSAVDARSPVTSLAVTALATPIAAAGLVVHAVPYGVMKVVGGRPKKDAMKATIKLLGCTGLFAIEYATIGVIVGRRRGAVAGVAAAAAAPASGWVTVWLGERLGRFGGIAHARDAVRARDGWGERLVNERAEVVRLTQSLIRTPAHQPAATATATTATTAKATRPSV
jgi:1-acyl-sn-glycerol-3-phosphate acyltransferase